MFRTLLSILAVSVFALAQSGAAGAAQASSASRVQAAPAVQPEMSTINLNTASIQELETLPGIGAKTAGLIIAYRQKNGPFKKIEELMNVQGIGEKSFLKLKPQLTVAATKGDSSK